MHIRNLIIAASTCLIASRSLAQNDEGQYTKYRHFAIYAGVGPSYFFNNLTTFKDDVNPWGYEFSFRFMWEPKGSFVSLGFETGYYRIYSVERDQFRSSPTVRCFHEILKTILCKLVDGPVPSV